MVRCSASLLLILGWAAFVFCQDAPGKREGVAVQKVEDKPQEHGSYGIGWNIGNELAGQGFRSSDIALKDFLAGIQDALAKANCRLTEGELQVAFAAIGEKMTARATELAKAKMEEGVKFLADNKKKDGVIALPSGLQYRVIKAGGGTQPNQSSKVKVHYVGKLLNGTVFDSSVARGEPAEFPVMGVIKGWSEALQRMKVGDKWQLFIPSELAYGERGAGRDIGPNEVLTFEVELLEVK
jgi:FKBP-type peptidyl-prolyl cis-trans isomerase FklB